MKRLLAVAAIVIAAGLVYIKVPSTYFCSYDDFIELHRAAFEDAVDPFRIITTPHFISLHYRPLNRAVNFLTYQLAGVNPEFYRTRNLAFHLVNVVLVYLLGWKLCGSIRISVVSALFFGLHPVANQTIIGAVHTNTIAHAAFLGALLMFMRSVERCRHWAFWLTGSVFTGWLGLMAYDSSIVVFGLMLLWLILNLNIVRNSVGKATHFLILFSALSVSLLTSYFVLRYLYASGGFTQAGSTLPGAGVIIKNAFMYAASLLLPLDVVLANEWLNAPLPSELQFSLSPLIIALLLCLIGICVGLTFLWWLRGRRRRINYARVAFILSGIATPLVPVLLFQPRPSETYLYLPVAFYSILLSYGLAQVATNKAGSRVKAFYIPVLSVLITLFASATWVRNNRVSDCGETARRTLEELPHELLRNGRWKVWFANIPGETATRRYGFYGFHGIDAIGPAAITPALQLIYRNRLLTGEIVEPQQLRGTCVDQKGSEICLLVHSDGRLERVRSLCSTPVFTDSAESLRTEARRRQIC